MLDWFKNGRFPLYLAPMARYTDIIFRQFCKEQGADVMVTEFVQADALVRGDPRLWETVDFTEEQRPMGIQIFGSNPDSMGEAAKMLADRMQPDFIDINFGCPADRVICMDAGSSMLRNPAKLGKVTGTVVRAVPHTPVTIKIRIGWDDETIVAEEVGHIAQEEGARALAIHGRTKMQAYRGEANWDVIAQTAAALDIPVIGNGNIRDAQDVARIREKTPLLRRYDRSRRTRLPMDLPRHQTLPPTRHHPPATRTRRTLAHHHRLHPRDHATPLPRTKTFQPPLDAPQIHRPNQRHARLTKIRTALGTVNQIEDLERVAQEHIHSQNQSAATNKQTANTP